MNAESMALVGEQLPLVPRPLGTPSLDGADRAVQQRGHHGGNRPAWRPCSEEALMRDLADDAAVAQNVQQARGMAAA